MKAFLSMVAACACATVVASPPVSVLKPHRQQSFDLNDGRMLTASMYWRDVGVEDLRKHGAFIQGAKGAKACEIRAAIKSDSATRDVGVVFCFFVNEVDGTYYLSDEYAPVFGCKSIGDAVYVLGKSAGEVSLYRIAARPNDGVFVSLVAYVSSRVVPSGNITRVDNLGRATIGPIVAASIMKIGMLDATVELSCPDGHVVVHTSPILPKPIWQKW